MRKLAVCCGCLVALGLPAGSGALIGSTGDGTLVVRDARGSVGVAVRGGIIGRFDQGRVYIDTPIASDGVTPSVYGYESETKLTPTKTLYIGFDVRFRVIGGFFRVKVNAQSMNISVVGKGSTTLNGAGWIDPGSYALNGDPFVPMPDTAKTVQLGTP
jgi:hypothetical protein